MATIDEYSSGLVLRSIRRAHATLRFTGVPVAGRFVTRMMEQRISPFAIIQVTPDIAREVIRKSRCCAAGPRVCSPLFPESPASESVFLDDLAEAMTRAGKSRMVTGEEACAVLDRYPKNPILLSKVSGRYLEVCRSEPSVCIYWKLRGICRPGVRQ